MTTLRVGAPVELLLVAYLDMDADEIIRDPDEAKRREEAGKRIKGLFRFPRIGEQFGVDTSEAK